MTRRTKGRAALLVMFSDPSWYSPTVNTSHELRRRGYEVHLVRRATTGPVLNAGADFGPGTRFHTVGGRLRHTALAYVHFLCLVLLLSLRHRPDIIIGYDPPGSVAAFLARCFHPALLIYHNYDLIEYAHSSRLTRLIHPLELAAARRADAVLVSSPGRAHHLAREARLPRPPYVCLNCLPLHTRIPRTGELRHILNARNITMEHVVVRLGSIAPGHGIEATIRSVAFWPEGAGFVLAGMPVAGAFLARMQELVSRLALQHRILILPSVSDDLWYDCLAEADLGIALYEPITMNHQHMWGAGLKLGLYLAAGIPSVVSDLPDFAAFARASGAAVTVDQNSPESIAAGVRSALAPSRNTAYREAARHTFADQYNFEVQFAPLFALLATLPHTRPSHTAVPRRSV